MGGIVTAPLNKAALWEAGHHYPGHTELLAELCGRREVAMMLYLSPGGTVQGRVGLGVVHVTLHMALRDVASTLTADSILWTSRLAEQAGRNLLAAAGIDGAPRVGVCAFNPHAGEQGLFGDEEIRLIAPAIERGRAEGMTLIWPAAGGYVADAGRRRGVRYRRGDVSRPRSHCIETPGHAPRGKCHSGFADCAHQRGPWDGIRSGLAGDRSDDRHDRSHLDGG